MYQLSYVEYYQMFTLSAFIFFPKFLYSQKYNQLFVHRLAILSKKAAYKIV